MDSADENHTVRLLRLAGARPSAPDARAARVRAAVHQQWALGHRRGTVRRRVLTAAAVLATAAALIVVVGRALRTDRAPAPTDQVMAVVERIDGNPRRSTDIANSGATRGLSPRDVVRAGEWIVTDVNGRVALRFSDGTSMRLDRGSRARLLSASVIELLSGAVYLDTDRTSEQFEVRTAVATARDVGTQFEVRLIDMALRLRVRTGVVELRDGRQSVSGRGGTEITFSAAGAVTRPIAPHGSEWDWTASVAPPWEIEGLALSEFLERAAREHGWTLRYADAALASEASGIILHGSVNGLPPREALAIAITTSGLNHQLENGELLVFRASGVKKPL